jgi:TolB-like protein
VTPEEAATIGQDIARARAAGDPEALTRIGIRLYRGQDYAAARDLLAEAMKLSPSFASATWLGLALERLGRLDEAEAAYHEAGRLPMSRGQLNELSRHLAALARTRLVAEAREAIAREAALSSQPADPATIAVLPWTYVGRDASLRPLGTGLAHLMVTDLKKLSSVQLIERERVQTLLDEIALVEEGRVDARTAARTGRLLRAGRVIHGVIRETARGIQLEATVLRTSDASVEATGTAGDRLERLFVLQKAIVLDLVDQLGLPMTPAEQRELSERPTQDLQAFLVLSRGLEAERRGDYRPAALERAAGAAGPDGTSRSEALWSALLAIAPSTGGLIDQRTRLPVSNPRTPEALRQDNPTRISITGEVVIVIPRP